MRTGDARIRPAPDMALVNITAVTSHTIGVKSYPILQPDWAFGTKRLHFHAPLCNLDHFTFIAVDSTFHPNFLTNHQFRRIHTASLFKRANSSTALLGRRMKRSEEHTSELQSLRHLVC